MSDETRRLTASEVLQRYKDEDLPAFGGIELADVNQMGIFGERPLDVAAIRGNAEEVRALVEGGADVNAQSEMGNTALHEAVLAVNQEVISLLLQFGASIDLRNQFGDTAVDVAHKLNRQDLVALLDEKSRHS